MSDSQKKLAGASDFSQHEKILVCIDHKPSPQSSFRLNVKLELPSTGVSMIYGASGSGKTTLLRCIAGLERAEDAEISVAGKIWQSRSVFLKTHKRSLGFVFQEASLLPFMTAYKNLALAAEKSKTTVTKLLFEEVVDLMGLENLLQQKPNQLSGGERQRVAIARALLLRPSVLLFDEPLASLDRNRKEEILPYLEKLQAQTNTPILYVTHSDDEVLRLASHLVVLEQGACKGMGPIQEVAAQLNLPASNYSDRSAVFSARVSKRESAWGLLLAEFGGAALWLADNSEEIGSIIRLRIKASDVSIALTDHQDSSILNRLPATVIDIQAEEGSAMGMVKLQVAEAVLLARVSKWSIERLKLQIGVPVWAQLKAVAIAY
jgi:molybdate transport system ATP-binding protein